MRSLRRRTRRAADWLMAEHGEARRLSAFVVVSTLFVSLLAALGGEWTGLANQYYLPQKVSICHATGSATNPFVQITVDNDALKGGHANHAGDIIPAPPGGCPAGPRPAGGGGGGGGGGGVGRPGPVLAVAEWGRDTSAAAADRCTPTGAPTLMAGLP